MAEEVVEGNEDLKDRERKATGYCKQKREGGRGMEKEEKKGWKGGGGWKGGEEVG